MKPSEKPIDRVDKFFKNKLEDHTMAPSENAWAKVEAGLSKKNNVVLWRWAAAVLLTGALISIIYQSRKENNQPVLAEKNLPAGKAGIEKEKSIASTETKKISAEPSARKVVREDTNHGEAKRVVREDTNHGDSEDTNHGEDADHGQAKKVNQRVKTLPKEIQKDESVAVTEEQNKKLADKNINQGIVAEEKMVRENKNQATPEQKVASTQQKPIKLEFTLEDLPSEEKVATTNEVKSSGIKKVLQLARDMKQGEGPMSGLREKKDELLAHNFITGKERNQ